MLHQTLIRMKEERKEELAALRARYGSVALKVKKTILEYYDL